MILGDTNSSIAAIVAERLHIPVYHMEAGNRSFDNNVPEELNRKIVDHVASFNLPYNDYSMRNLLAEGIHPRFIQKTGSPIREIYEYYKNKIVSSTAVEDLGLTPDGYFLVSVHRQENVDLPERLEKVLDCLIAVREKWNIPVMVSTHPRTRVRLEALARKDLEGITFHEPFGYLDYNKLQLEAKCVISDSGTISEESSILGFSAVSLRDSSERPESLESGSVILTGLSPDLLLLSMALEMESKRNSFMPAGYEVNDFSSRVLGMLISTALKHGKWKGLE
jgi:UDP-N-acetylglucosamine 2-epimerase (non-hydrolysing)